MLIKRPLFNLIKSHSDNHITHIPTNREYFQLSLFSFPPNNLSLSLSPIFSNSSKIRNSVRKFSNLLNQHNTPPHLPPPHKKKPENKGSAIFSEQSQNNIWVYSESARILGFLCGWVKIGDASRNCSIRYILDLEEPE